MGDWLPDSPCFPTGDVVADSGSFLWETSVVKGAHKTCSSSPLLDDFRIFVGDLGNDVNDDLLARTFSKYPTFMKARVIRDKWTKKAKGYGFVSFKDPHDFMQAMREMNGEKHVHKGYVPPPTHCLLCSTHIPVQRSNPGGLFSSFIALTSSPSFHVTYDDL